MVNADQEHSALNYWLANEVNDEEVVEEFQSIVSSAPRAITDPLPKPTRIALIYPSADLSDFWVRNYKALTARLNVLNIDYVIDEFSSRQIEHALQTRYIDEVLARQNEYDYVIYGPSELYVQADNIQRLAKSENFQSYIWAFHTPMKSWQFQPDAWFDFSSSAGAFALCEFMIQRLGRDVSFAMNRGIPGITDDQRSGDFKSCVEEEGGWVNFYEHFGQYQAGGGRDGAALITQNFPEVTMLHNANTAMTLGSLEYLAEQALTDSMYVAGWGGTAAEIEQIKQGNLNATPMRMGDDVGVATAEAIKFSLEGRTSEIPKIYLGRIEVVDDQMSAEEIDARTREAFRYSGVEHE
ncbi:MAG: substrate-binding domain-containing protein [Marinomonas atlantica]|nr:substrate-binding domain-containing protein [Marinomonas atlantica]